MSPPCAGKKAEGHAAVIVSTPDTAVACKGEEAGALTAMEGGTMYGVKGKTGATSSRNKAVAAVPTAVDEEEDEGAANAAGKTALPVARRAASADKAMTLTKVRPAGTLTDAKVARKP